jgi:hypothetical protein
MDMTSFYCKLNDEDFFLLLDLFSAITSRLELQENTPAASLSVEFVYKMVQASVRVLWKRNTKSTKGHSLELLCHQLGKKCKCLSNEINLKKLYLYLQKKKLQRRVAEDETSRGMVDSIIKGMTGIIRSKN